MKKRDRMLMKSETVISEKEIDLHRTESRSLRQRIKAIIDADVAARFVVCGLLLVFFALLQTTVFARFRLLGAVPDLMLPLTIAVGMTERGRWGAIFGIAAAFVIESLGGATVSVFAPLYMLAGYLAGCLTEEIFRDTPATRAAYTLAACFAHIFFTLFTLFATVEELRFGDALRLAVLPEFLASLVFAPIPHAVAWLALKPFHKPREEKVQ